MPPDRFLQDTVAGEAPRSDQIQELVEAESGKGSQGIRRTWLASDSSRVVLTSDQTGVKISRDNGVTAPTNVVNNGTTAGGDLSGTYPNPSLSTATIDALIPVGTIWAFAAGGVPSGWLHCNGAAVSRTTYAKLFATLGTIWNTGGEAPTEFRVPNLAGRVLLGSGGVYTFATLGGVAAVPGPLHTHIGSHSHGMNSHIHGLNNHTHPPGSHVHAAPTHEHTIGHAHDLSNHTHNLDHNHALAAGVAVASGAITGVHEGPSAVVNVSASNHAHDVDLPALGTVASGIPSTNGTGAMPATSSGTNAAADTGAPSPVPTGGNTGDTTGATGLTALDSSAPAASYTETIPTMMPYGVATYIIRCG